jgi:hypothetical protein
MTFSCENKDDETIAFMHRTSMECREPIGDVTIPLYTEQNGKTFLCGSGLLLRVGEKSFIVSAGHTFDARRTLDLPLWVTSGVPGSKLLPLGEVLIRSSETNDPCYRTDEPFDIAVCELTDETASQICGQKRFLRLNDVDSWDRQDPRSWFMVYGYPTKLSPAEEATNSINANAVAFATFIYCDERGTLDRFDKEVGIKLDFDPTEIWDDDGRLAVPPHPDGMSGCGIWRLVEAGVDAKRWKVDDIKLVAIDHSLRPKKKVLVALP